MDSLSLTFFWNASKRIQGIFSLGAKKNVMKKETRKRLEMLFSISRNKRKYGSIRSIEQVGIIIKSWPSTNDQSICSVFDRLFSPCIVRRFFFAKIERRYKRPKKTPKRKEKAMRWDERNVFHEIRCNSTFVWMCPIYELSRPTFIPVLRRISVNSMQLHSSHIDCLPLQQYNNAQPSLSFFGTHLFRCVMCVSVTLFFLLLKTYKSCVSFFMAF